LNGAVKRLRVNLTQISQCVWKLREEIYLFHEIKPNFHCGDIHETDARSTPFNKETLYRIFGKLTNFFSLFHGHKQSEYRKNAVGSSFILFYFFPI